MQPDQSTNQKTRVAMASSFHNATTSTSTITSTSTAANNNNNNNNSSNTAPISAGVVTVTAGHVPINVSNKTISLNSVNQKTTAKTATLSSTASLATTTIDKKKKIKKKKKRKKKKKKMSITPAIPTTESIATTSTGTSNNNNSNNNNITKGGTPIGAEDFFVPLKYEKTCNNSINNITTTTTPTATSAAAATTTTTQSSKSSPDITPDPVVLLKRYLQDRMLCDTLNEDKFCIEMIEHDRMSNDRLRFRPESDQTPHAYQEEIALSQDQTFFKELCTKTAVDKRTVNWLRRKVGWNELTEMTGRLTDDSDDDYIIGVGGGDYGDDITTISPDSSAAPNSERSTNNKNKNNSITGGTQHPRIQRRRRKTRGSKRIHNLHSKERGKHPIDDTKDNEEMGLTALALAVTDLEEDYGAFKSNDRIKQSSLKRKQPTQRTERRQSLLQDLSRLKRSSSKSSPSSSITATTTTAQVPAPAPPSNSRKRQKPTQASAATTIGTASANVTNTISVSSSKGGSKPLKKRKGLTLPTRATVAATTITTTTATKGNHHNKNNSNDSMDTDFDYHSELIGSVSTDAGKAFVFDASGLSPRIDVIISKILIGGKEFREKVHKNNNSSGKKNNSSNSSNNHHNKKAATTPVSPQPTKKTKKKTKAQKKISTPKRSATPQPLSPRPTRPPLSPVAPAASSAKTQPVAPSAAPLSPPAPSISIPRTPATVTTTTADIKSEEKLSTRTKKKKKKKKKKVYKGPRLLSSPLTSTPKIASPRFLNSKAKKIGSPMVRRRNSEEGRISLSLLEWRRRQQWTPTKDDTPSILHTDEDPDEGIIKVAANLDASGVETELPSWLAINKYSEMTRQPPMIDPPRTVHNDRQYATWCSRLINCLNGSGRSWARHEFFYSDLDRPWYNFNEFHVDLAKVGVSPNAKLTRSEWSLVRQQIRKKPRRFSKKFIRKEMVRLIEYRKIVRRVQHTIFPLPATFAYSIPAPIPVGATVTAYNRKYRVLHRGTVLSYEINRCMYLIQFERKELGFEFCFDFEVSSHGVPEYKHIAKEISLDGTLTGAFSDLNNELGGLVYGTSYALTLNNWQQQHKGASLKPIETNRRNPIQDDECFLKTPSDYNSVDSEALVDKVAERECVIKLLDVIEKGLYRKNMLLNAIERMNRHQEQSALATTIQREPKETLAEQYSWIFANLEATNEVLEAAVAHMQIMYCNPLDESVTSKATVEKEMAREEALNDIDMTSPYTRVGIGAASPWASSLLKLTELGRTICKDGGNEDDDDIKRSPLDARQAYLESRMGRATGFLLAMNEASRLTEPMVQSNHAVPVAMESVSKLCLDRVLVLPEVSDGGSEGLSCALQGRASAMEELREALDGFNAEFTMLHSKTVETQN